jgi:hypothetical protein
LAKIKKGHDGCFLVLWWIALEDLVDELGVLLSELERDVGIVFRTISVLWDGLSVSGASCTEFFIAL